MDVISIQGIGGGTGNNISLCSNFELLEQQQHLCCGVCMAFFISSRVHVLLVCLAGTKALLRCHRKEGGTLPAASSVDGTTWY